MAVNGNTTGSITSRQWRVNGIAGIVAAVLQHLCWQGDVIRFLTITKQSTVVIENQSAQDQQCGGEGIASVVVVLQQLCQGKSEPVAMASKQHQHSNIWGGRQQATVDMVNNNQPTVMVTGAAVGGCIRIFLKQTDNQKSEGD